MSKVNEKITEIEERLINDSVPTRAFNSFEDISFLITELTKSLTRERLLKQGCEELAEYDCACESETPYTPGFTCGSHKYLLSLFEEVNHV